MRKTARSRARRLPAAVAVGAARRARRHRVRRDRRTSGGGRWPHRVGWRGGGHRHPQDQARHRDHAGEPLVRLLLRHLSRRRRHPDAQRRADGLRPRPGDGAVRQAVPRPARRERRRPARRAATRVADINGGQDGRLHRPGRAGARRLPRPPTTRRAADPAPPDVMGYHDGARDPELLGVRPATSCCRTTCSSRTRRGACPRTCSWSRAGRRSARDPTTRELRATTTREPEPPPPRAAAPDHGRSTRWTDLTYLLHKGGSSWALLRRRRAPSPTATTTRLDLRTRRRRTRAPPGSGTRCRTSTPCSGRPARQHPAIGRLLRRGREAARCRRCRGSCPTWAERAPAGADRAGPGLRDRARQRRHEGPDWDRTAIFLAWDDWGGFYDHVPPPIVDQQRLRAAGAGS